MTEEKSDLMDSARLWMLRVNEPDFADWDDLSEWLEADPGHLAAYETALDEDAWASDLSRLAGKAPLAAEPAHLRVVPDAVPPASRPARQPARPLAPRPLARRPWLALAAALAAIGGWTMLAGAPDGSVIVTAPGEHRSIALADGSRIELNGDSRLTYDPDRPRLVSLERGEAVFEVRHDEADPFVVTVGKARLIDVGTVFNVVHDNGALEVAVAEGAVVYEAGRKDADKPIRLSPGDALSRPGAAAPVELGKADPASVGSWRDGVLQYDDAKLATIARDLSRTLGKPVRGTARVERMRYSGTLAIDGPAQDVMARIGPLLGLTFRESADGWEMMPTDGPMR